jgi:hypothetical protein
MIHLLLALLSILSRWKCLTDIGTKGYAKAQADDRHGGPRAKPGAEDSGRCQREDRRCSTDVFGLSGQLMLEALVKGLDGKGQPSAFIAQLARGHARKKLDQLSWRWKVIRCETLIGS